MHQSRVLRTLDWQIASRFASALCMALGIRSMSKTAAHTFSDDGKLSAQEAEKLLGVLCVKYGFCLPSLWHARLERNPPRSIDKFLDTVIRAEGLDPITADSGMYKAMREEVRLAFERSKLAPRDQGA